jgi:hypothetical protein
MLPFLPVVLNMAKNVPDEELPAFVIDPCDQPALVVANIEDNARSNVI